MVVAGVDVGVDVGVSVANPTNCIRPHEQKLFSSFNAFITIAVREEERKCACVRVSERKRERPRAASEQKLFSLY